jgi:hypothetical protein
LELAVPVHSPTPRSPLQKEGAFLMSTLGGIDHISNDSPVTVLVLDHGYNTHSPPVILVSDWRQLASQPPDEVKGTV